MKLQDDLKERIDFEYFALKYEKFRSIVNRSNAGKLYLDFKNPKCLQALSWCLLKENLDLDVNIPLNKLIPTVPLRLNYILWIENIFNSKNLSGIDIGCGASCIYPLIGAKKNNWRFLAIESDSESYSIAVSNVSQNNLKNLINVKIVNDTDCLSDMLENNLVKRNLMDNKKPFRGDSLEYSDTYLNSSCVDTINNHLSKDNQQSEDITNESTKLSTALFDFIMCNPPFFDSSIEAINKNDFGEVKRRKVYSTADISERFYYDGGEVGFVYKFIVEESLKLRDKIKVYTTMLGKKESRKKLINLMKNKNIENIGMTEFCQGKTIRWGLAWSFDKNIKFPVYKKKSHKSKESFSFRINKFSYGVNWDMVDKHINDIINELKAETVCISEAFIGEKIYILEFKNNAWSNQRKVKRQLKRNIKQFNTDDGPVNKPKIKCIINNTDINNEANSIGNNICCNEVSNCTEMIDNSVNVVIEEAVCNNDENNENLLTDGESLIYSVKSKCTENNFSKSGGLEDSREKINETASNIESVTMPSIQDDHTGILKSKLIVMEEMDYIEIKLELISAANRDYLHCLFQLLKNRLLYYN